MVGLSKKTEKLVARVFPDKGARTTAQNMLTSECGNGIPFCENSSPEDLERIRFAVLKLSEGDLKKLQRAIELANLDWRDLFMEAGFGHDVEAHNKWYAKKTEVPSNSSATMAELRHLTLTRQPSELGINRSGSCVRTYGVVMDWPIEDAVVSIVSLCDGNASLYTTSTFGIIGGYAHEKVRKAAIDFVAEADKHFASSKPTKDYSYPANDRIQFLLLTFDGVRAIRASRESVESDRDDLSPLFGRGQAVITELRSITEAK